MRRLAGAAGLWLALLASGWAGLRVYILEPAREEELREVVAAGEARAEELRSAVERGDRLRFDDRLVREQMASFDDLWTTLSVEQQAGLLRHLVERVGYDARGDKVKVIYNSNGIREFCQGGVK